VGGVIILLFAALTACSDGLSAGDDDPLADKAEHTVSGITFLQVDPPIYWIHHGANVGLRLLSTPDDYIYTDISDEETGYYSFPLEGLDNGYYVVDGGYSNATTEWFGTSASFEWNSGYPGIFTRHVWMYEQ